jgi:hypothetical protein
MAPLFLTSALDGGEWSASGPDCFISGEGAHGAHWLGGFMGLRAGLDVIEKIKSYFPTGNRTPTPRSKKRRWCSR